MDMNAVPVYEMKNKLSYYLHKVDTQGPVYISVRGKPTYVIKTIIDDDKEKNIDIVKKTKLQEIREITKIMQADEENFDMENFLEAAKVEDYYLLAEDIQKRADKLAEIYLKKHNK